MKTISIKHPLRNIVYQVEEPGLSLNHEMLALDNYRQAHDMAWHMKMRFEQENGKVLLAQIDLDKLNEERIAYESMRDYYFEQIDFSNATKLLQLDIKLQVELRDLYNQVKQQHYTMIKFYDKIGTLDLEYQDIVAIYFKNEKPLDPLNFKVLEDIFIHHEDMDVDVVSLDTDLQSFLQVLTDIYALLDDYTVSYAALHTAYGHAVNDCAAFTKSLQVLNRVWENHGS